MQGGRATGDPFAPWVVWRSRATLSLEERLLVAASLSASSHNSQPWAFVVNDSVIHVFADCTRNLGALDARRRDLVASIGCAIESIAIAASESGHSAEIKVVVDRFDRDTLPPRFEIAQICLRDGGGRSPLVDAIGIRRTDRRPFDPLREVDESELAVLRDLCRDPVVRLLIPDDMAERDVIGTAVSQATDIIVETPAMVRASDRWIRTRTVDIEHSPDGITLAAAGAPAVLVNVMERLFRPSPRENHASWPAMTRTGISSAPLMGLLAVRDPFSVPDAISCGRIWQRLHLAAASAGLAVQAFSQIAQVIDQRSGRTFPALEELFAQRFGMGWQPMIAFRLGHSKPPPPGPSPRRTLSDMMMEKPQ